MTSGSIVIGIGCRRGVSVEEIEAAVLAALGKFGKLGTRSLADVRVIASIEGKSDEAALLAFCERHELPLRFYTAAQIADVETDASPHVQKHLGVGGVCEPCALLASHEGRIVVPKTTVDDVTVAIAADRHPLPSSSKGHA